MNVFGQHVETRRKRIKTGHNQYRNDALDMRAILILIGEFDPFLNLSQFFAFLMKADTKAHLLVPMSTQSD